MPTWPQVKFVADSSVGATVRYDLQSKPARVLADGFTLGAPQLEGDPAAAARQWGYRTVTINQMVDGPKSTAMSFVAALAKELLRPRNWLLFQLSPLSKPVWLRTYQTQPGDISFENVNSEDGSRPDLWRVAVTLDADPFIYGQRVTIPTITVNNDPSAATNPCLAVLPTILGDAPAPLRIRVTGDWRGATALLSSLGSALAPTTQIMPTVAGAFTDTTASTGTNAGFIGGNYHTISFATNTNMATRLTYTGPVVQHATYKVLLRVKASAVATYGVQIQVSNSFPIDVTVPVASSIFTYLDLGVMDWPPGGRVDDDWLAGASSSFGQASLRISGTVPLIVDAMVLIPIDMDDAYADTLTVIYPQGITPSASVIDGRTKSTRLVSSGTSDTPRATDIPAIQLGSHPRVYPGIANVLRFFQTMASDDITKTAVVDLSYQPQWLWLADA